VELKTLLEGTENLLLEPGWRSGYRASLEIKQKRARARNGKTAGGLRARRGSNPFPGATNILLDKSQVFYKIIEYTGARFPKNLENLNSFDTKIRLQFVPIA
jgi:hypothetical protein